MREACRKELFTSISPGDWCRGPSACRWRGGPGRWRGRAPGGSHEAKWGQCMKGGLCTETCSQNRSQTRGGGKSIIYVFITSLNLGCSWECCLVVATCCRCIALNWRTIETSLALQTQIVYPNLSCISLTSSDCCNFLFTISPTDSESRCGDDLSPRGPKHDWACLQPVGCCNQSHTGDTGQPSLDTRRCLLWRGLISYRALSLTWEQIS